MIFVTSTTDIFLTLSKKKRHFYVFATREIRNVFNKIVKVSEDMPKYKTL